MPSMPSPRNWASHGSEPKIILSHHQLPIGVSNGMPNRNKSPWERRKRKNTLMPYVNGCFGRPTPFTKCKSYMGNSSIHAILCHMDKRTLPSWRPCYGSVTTILSSHIPIQNDSEMTLIGGLTPSANRLSPDQYPDLYHSMMLGHSLMQAQALELESLLAVTGELGDSSRGGTPSTESRTLGGQKPLALNCSRDLSSTFPLDRKHSTSSSTGTILGWSKDGGMVEAKMKLSTQSSGGYTHYLKATVTDTRFIPPMSRASQIQQTDSREASTP